MLLGIESGRHWAKTIAALGLTDGGDFKSDWHVARAGTDWRNATTRVDEKIAERSYDEWHQIFTAQDVWHTPINKYEDMMDDEHANAAGTFAEVPGLKHRLMKSPITLSSQAGKDGPTGRAPAFGEHTTEVLQNLGFSREQISALREKNIVK